MSENESNSTSEYELIKNYENVDILKKNLREFEVKTGSTTACAAKWFQSTLHLQNGLTQSCYNTPQHPIDRNLLELTPSALHNTPEKFRQREMMKGQQKPAGCEYCWRIENQKSEAMSDRNRWNSLLGRDIDATLIKNLPANYLFSPKVLEVSFSNLCNFMCGYCHPKNSSRYFNEIKQFGPYEGVPSHYCDIHFLKIFDEDSNPYLDAFWKWWPTLSEQLFVIRLTGGEPLIQKSTMKLLSELKASPRPNLDLAINSNLGLNPKMFEKFCDTAKDLVEDKCVKRIQIFTSIDTWGNHAEYIRHGLDLEIFKTNVNYFLKTFPGQDLFFMVTFNLFSLARFTELLEFWKELKLTYNQDLNRIRVYVNMLTEPIVFSYLLLPEEFAVGYFDKILDYIDRNFESTNVRGFNDFVRNDIIKVKNDYLNNQLSSEALKSGREEFVRYFKQYDLRKNKSLLQTFPEYAEIFSSWEREFLPAKEASAVAP